MSYLLDTNVLSEVRKANGDAKVKAWFAAFKGDDLFLSVLVLGEIRQGIVRLKRRDSRQAGVYDAWLTSLKHNYREHILPITNEVAETWGRLNSPDPLPVVDSLLAATASVHSLTLVTRNVADITRTGVPLLNPFD